MRFSRFLRNRAVGLTRRVAQPIRGWRAQRAPGRLELGAVSRRLELLLAGMYGRPIRVGPAGRSGSGAATSDPDVILPAVLDAPDGIEAAAARYRLLAVQQAERLVRGSAAAPLPTDRMVRDLYALVEGASVDRAIADRAPGLAATLDAIHARARAARPALRRLPENELEVELIARALLGEETTGVGSSLAVTTTAAESLAWARAEAERIRGRPGASRRYRGVAGIAEWKLSSSGHVPDELPPMPGLSVGDMRTAAAAAPSAQGKPSPSESDGTEGSSDQQAGDGAASTADAPGAETVPDEAGDIANGVASSAREPRARRPGISYPEWNHYAGRYEPDATTVLEEPADRGEERWALETLAEHAPIVRQIRARFSQLRAQRQRLRAQRAGDDLDLDACVSALVDLRMRRVPSDRLYLHTRPARRTLAIVLLVDVSGSTRTRVSDDRTVLDVERMTVLLASEALDALGDPYAVLAFSGAGAHDVQMRTVKRFAGDDRVTVHRRIAGLASMDYTRLGAALRHATALLNAQPAERRLLLLISDGKPNDLRGYQGAYAVEDSRRALAEARACGVHPFCLTVDREETEYLPHLFGASGYRLIRAPAQLPAALLRVVELLLPH